MLILRIAADRRTLLKAVCLLMMVGHQSFASAANKVDTTGCSWATESNNGKYTFAGIQPTPIHEQLSWLRECSLELEEDKLAAIEQRVRQIHDKFPVSGMYEEGDPPKLLWSAHWYTYSKLDGFPGPGGWASDGMPSEDGSRLVVPFPTEMDEALFAVIYGPDRLTIPIRRDSIVSPYECMLRRHVGFSDAWPRIYECELGPSGTTLLLEFGEEEFAEISLCDGRVVRSTVFPTQFRIPIFGMGIVLAIVAAAMIIRGIRSKYLRVSVAGQ